jgi:poly(3-hydroxybutyrate) depolymerase
MRLSSLPSASLLLFCVGLGCSSAVTNGAPLPGGDDGGVLPPPGSNPDAGIPPGPPPCDGKAGTFHDQPFDSNGETRHYYLHVPQTYACEKAWPLLVDFHGTGFGSTTDTVEESWALPEMVSVSDKEGFLVVRPRSRSKAMNGGNVYQWDINAGDVAKNQTFVRGLVAELAKHYHIDPLRTYATGFSNGPNMALSFMADDPALFHGYGAVSGGLHQPLERASDFGTDAPRIYAMTGFRDYMMSTQRELVRSLAKYHYPSDKLFIRETDTGHEIYDWHYAEAWAWMDRGGRPKSGALGAGWTRETFAGTDSLLAIARAPDGTLHVSGSNGAIWKRAPAGGWTRTGQIKVGNVAPALTSVCWSSDGVGYAAGEGVVAKTDDGASWSALAAVPEFGANQFGRTFATSVACGGGRVTVGGVWSAATSTDGASWQAASADSGGATAFLSSVRRSESGTWLTLGYYDYVGRSADGVTFTAAQPPAEIQWLNDAASAPGGKWWIVGEKGTIFASTDDGVNFSTQTSPTKEDLYAVAFASNGATGIAVGAHGAAILTRDGGATWTSIATGLDGFLGDVVFLDATTALVVGEAGIVLTYHMT